MTPILASYGYMVFNTQGQFVALFGIEAQAREFAAARGFSVGRMVRFTAQEEKA